jgi:hypothetical protein
VAEKVTTIMPTSPLKKFNLPLPEEMHRALFAESRRTGVPATRLVRSALEDWLRQQRRDRRRDEIRQFAMEHAGGEYDLDPVLESVAAEELRRFDDEDDRETR